MKERAAVLIIASMRSWDGSRILGAFDSEKEALKACNDAGYDVEGDEFYLDVVEMNKVSDSQHLVLDPSVTTKNFKRVHIYSCAVNTPEKDKKDMNT